MIQRIQTIYLTLSIVLLALMFVFSIATIEGSGNIYEFSIFGLFQDGEIAQNIEKANFPIYIGVCIIIALLVFTIGQFKNRKRQIKFARLAFLLDIVLIVGTYFLADFFNKTVESEKDPVFTVGIYLAVACLPLIFLAIRGIKKDEALVKSLDRIR